MDSLEIQDEEKACSHPTRMSMRRDRAQSGWSYLASTLLFLPRPVTLLHFQSSHCHISSYMQNSLLPSPPIQPSGRHLSAVCCSEKPSLTSHYTPLGTTRRPLPAIHHSCYASGDSSVLDKCPPLSPDSRVPAPIAQYTAALHLTRQYAPIKWPFSW